MALKANREWEFLKNWSISKSIPFVVYKEESKEVDLLCDRASIKDLLEVYKKFKMEFSIKKIH